jgi:hypothetical protein
MNDGYRSTLLFIASQLVVLSALIHVSLGALKWGEYAGLGILFPPDIRWPLFVVSGVAVLVGIGLARQSPQRRRWYLAGVVVMLVYVAAYFLWHLGGHRPLFILGPATHHNVTLEFVVAHYLAGSLETFTLTVELLAAVLLSILYVGTEK